MNWVLRNLNQSKTELLLASEEILDTAHKAGRDVSATEQVQLAVNTAKLDKIAAKIKREQELADFVPDPNRKVDDTWPGMINSREGRGDFGAAATKPQTKGGCIGATYQKLFGTPSGNEGWATAGEFFGTLHSGMSDPRLQMLNEGSGPSGGFLMPTQFSPIMLDSIVETSLILPRCRVYPMSTNELRVPGFDTSTAASGVLYGGITGAWIGEGGDITVTNPEARQLRLIARKLAILISVTNELSADALNLESQITGALQSAGSWFVDDSLLNGTGAGQPRGILTDPTCISVSAESGQDPDTILVENLHNMFSRLHPSCIPNSIWLCSVTAIPQLLQLSIPMGLGGQHVPVLNETNGSFSMLSRPVFFTEKMAALGDRGDILLVDPTQYSVGLRSELSIEKSAHIYFTSDKTAYRALIRLDGMGTWNAVYTPAHGSTLSWAVTLAAR